VETSGNCSVSEDLGEKKAGTNVSIDDRSNDGVENDTSREGVENT
jgi:hypothetical protein